MKISKYNTCVSVSDGDQSSEMTVIANRPGWPLALEYQIMGDAYAFMYVLSLYACRPGCCVHLFSVIYASSSYECLRGTSMCWHSGT